LASWLFRFFDFQGSCFDSKYFPYIYRYFHIFTLFTSRILLHMLSNIAPVTLFCRKPFLKDYYKEIIAQTVINRWRLIISWKMAQRSVVVSLSVLDVKNTTWSKKKVRFIVSHFPACSDIICVCCTR